MNKLYWLSSLALCVPQVMQAQEKPNIIFIMTDQQRGDAIGCSGNERIITPNIDALAHDGFYFCNAYSASPSSTPARAGLLTGMSPWHHGMLGYGNVAEHYRYEMPQMLSDCGYLTLGIGKMHWRPQNALHGFDATILDESGRVESHIRTAATAANRMQAVRIYYPLRFCIPVVHTDIDFKPGRFLDMLHKYSQFKIKKKRLPRYGTLFLPYHDNRSKI